jgi:hypothetical protein
MSCPYRQNEKKENISEQQDQEYLNIREYIIYLIKKNIERLINEL